jgi:putative ABC transport system permease protein
MNGSKTLEQSTAQALVEDRITSMLSTSFGVTALLLAWIGLFGLMSHNVTRRTREIGVRMALGCQRSHLMKMVLRESLLLTVIGVAVGVPCAIAAARLIRYLLFEVAPSDPLALLMAIGPLFLVGVIARFLAGTPRGTRRTNRGAQTRMMRIEEAPHFLWYCLWR